ncbi:MAG: cell division protein FtsL [Deltaproteobacteria bacterium]|nr:cell division protein FtsL [Deltaproteobacteria bacterium]
MNYAPRVFTGTQKIDILSKRDRTPLRVRLPILFVVFFCVLVGVCSVWERTQYVRVGYEIACLKEQNRKLKQEKRNLLLEYATSISLDRVESRARKKLHLHLPEEGQILYVK